MLREKTVMTENKIKNMGKNINIDRATAIVSISFTFLFLLIFHKSTMLFFEQTTVLFNFSKEFFEFCLRYFSFENYCVSFFTQFYHYPLLGAAVISCLCFLLMWLLKKTFGLWLPGALAVQGFLFTFQQSNIVWLLLLIGISIVVTLLSVSVKMSVLKRISKRMSKQTSKWILKWMPKRKSILIFGIVLIFALSVTQFFLINKAKNKLHKSTIYAISNKWDRIIDLGFEASKNSKTPMVYDVILSDYYKMALIFHGKLLDTVFSLPEPLFPFLYPEIPVKEHSPLRVLFARFYFENQMYSEALHLLHDQWVLGTRSPEVISFIIKTSIAARDFGPIKKYLS
ncbi:MAG: DUF6057 family protein, partial [Bacteroidales bacterium]|nr:DUF6057 family protein [Bacteroidales bacterium]